MTNRRRKLLKREREVLLRDLRMREGQRWDAKIRMWELLDTRRDYSIRRRSELLDYYGDKVGLQEESIDRDETQIELPTEFSFIESPEETLVAIKALVCAARRNSLKIRVDQRPCTLVDLCAGAVLNAMATEARRRIGTSFAGHYPTNREAAEIVAVTGLPHVLGLTRTPKHFKRFSTLRGGMNIRSLDATATKQRAATSVADYIESCFKKVRFDLRREAKRRIGNLAGEVLANAEGHAPQYGWWVDAYMRQPRSKAYGDCHLTLFNFGPPISETLQGVASTELRSVIQHLITEHRRRNYFGMRPDWTESALWTLYALQEGVTRHYGEPGSHHGIGTCDMIEEFQHLGGTIGGEQPKMCLISGHTHIVFDPKYRMEEVELEDGSRRRTIAFNAQNDLTRPPDAGTVRQLKEFFPGTLISLRFFMHEPYLVQTATQDASRNNRSREAQ